MPRDSTSGGLYLERQECERLRDFLARIENLAESPQWESDRRWRIGAIARCALAIVPAEDAEG